MTVLDLSAFIFISTVLLSFSISIVDGIPFFCAIWLSSVFLSCSSGLAADPTLTRLVWVIFALGMLIARLLAPTILRTLGLGGNLLHGSPPYLTRYRVSIQAAFLMFSLSLAVFVLSLTGYGSDSEFANTLHAESKSPFVYSLTGVSGILTLYASYSYFLCQDRINDKGKALFISLVILTPTFYSFLRSLAYLGVLYAYGFKLIAPFSSLVSYFMIKKLMWTNIFASLKRLRANTAIVASASFLIFLLFALYFFLSASSVDFLGLVLLKVLGRAEVYPLLDATSQDQLIKVYGGNFLYFFHPFLRLLGTKAYEMPMGTFLVSGFGSNVSHIGGPNVHLPLTLYFIFFGGFLGLLGILTIGFILGLLLYNSRRIIIAMTRGLQKPLLLHVFFYFGFSFLIVEPSAFSHSLLFAIASCILLRCLSLHAIEPAVTPHTNLPV